MSDEVKVEVHALGDLMTNCYLLHNKYEAILIDPGSPNQSLIDRLSTQNLNLSYIINTHGHIDHIRGNDFYKSYFPTAKIIIYEADMEYLTHPELNLSSEFSDPYLSPEPDVLIRGTKEYFEFFDEEGIFYHTPGHTPGSMCLAFPNRHWLFCGDTLFAGSIGRTDLPGGSFQDILKSIEMIMKIFSDETILFPGHGPESTIGNEKKMNPYILEYLPDIF
mgnify:CR=1 FL=1